MIAALLDLAIQIIDYARQHGRVTMAEIIRATGASRNILKDHFRNSWNNDTLSCTEAGRARVIRCRKLLMSFLNLQS